MKCDRYSFAGMDGDRAERAPAAPVSAATGGRPPGRRRVARRGAADSRMTCPEDMSVVRPARLDTYLERRKAFKTRQGIVAEASRPGSAANGSSARSRRRSSAEGIETARASRSPGVQGPYGVTGDAGEEATWAETSGARSRQPGRRAVSVRVSGVALPDAVRAGRRGSARCSNGWRRNTRRCWTACRNAGDRCSSLLADDLDNRARLSPGATRHPAAVPARHVMCA